MRRSRWKDNPSIWAEGIQSSGFNRLFTLYVKRTERDGEIEYDVRSSGYGAKTPWLSDYQGPTLKQALRGLQDYYEKTASTHSMHAVTIQSARKRSEA